MAARDKIINIRNGTVDTNTAFYQPVGRTSEDRSTRLIFAFDAQFAALTNKRVVFRTVGGTLLTPYQIDSETVDGVTTWFKEIPGDCFDAVGKMAFSVYGTDTDGRVFATELNEQDVREALTPTGGTAPNVFVSVTDACMTATTSASTAAQTANGAAASCAEVEQGVKDAEALRVTAESNRVLQASEDHAAIAPTIAEIADARGGQANLDARLDGFDAQLAQIANRKLPMKSLRPTRVWLAPTDNTASWTASGVTISADTSKYLVGDSKGLKVLLGTSGTVYTDVTSTNFSGKALCIGYYLHAGTPGGVDDWKNVVSMDIDLYSNGLTDTNHRLRVPIYNGGGLAETDSLHNKGWHFLGILPEREYASKGTLFDIAAVTRVRINTVNISGKTPSVTFGYIAACNQLTKGGCLTIVDNFADGVYQMAAYAASKNIRLNLSIVPSFVGTTGYATLDQIKECQDMGHFILNHTYDHTSLSAPGAKLSPEQCLSEYRNAYRWMVANGLGYGASVMSVPGAYFGDIAYDAVYPVADAIFHNWNTPTKHMLWMPYYPSARYIPQSSIDNSPNAITTAQDAAAWKAIAVNGYHGTYWTADNGVGWKAYIDGIAAVANLNHYTIDEVLCGGIA